MSLLTSKLPKTLIVNDAEYPIETDFRVFIEFETIICGEQITIETILKLFELCFKGDMPPIDDDSIDALILFYTGGKRQGKGDDGGEKPYFFECDDEYIYSAFLDQYNIDLQEVDYMHWWKFRSLFMSLKDDNEIVKIMGYRTFKPDSNTPVEVRNFYNKMKQLHQPPANQVEEEERKATNDFVKSLLGGDQD